MANNQPVRLILAILNYFCSRFSQALVHRTVLGHWSILSKPHIVGHFIFPLKYCQTDFYSAKLNLTRVFGSLALLPPTLIFKPMLEDRAAGLVWCGFDLKSLLMSAGSVCLKAFTLLPAERGLLAWWSSCQWRLRTENVFFSLHPLAYFIFITSLKRAP